MKKLSTQELINYIQTCDYTDIIFDCDETIMHLIIDWEYSHTAFSGFAKNLWLEQEFAIMGINQFLEHMLLTHGTDYRKFINTILLETETNHHTETIPNTPLLKFIKDNTHNYTFHVISNNMLPTIEKQLHVFEVHDCFTQIIWRDSVTFAKPNPEGIEFILKETGREPKKFLMVGDNVDSDGAAAKRAGIDCILIDMYL